MILDLGKCSNLLLFKSHSKILTTSNFNMISKHVPWIGEQWYIGLLFQQFSNITTYVSCVAKLSKLLFTESLFSNPGDKVLILVESTGQIYPINFLLFRTLYPVLENSDSVKSSFDNFATQLTYSVMLENCRNNDPMYRVSPIQGKSFLFMLKQDQGNLSRSLDFDFDFNDILNFVIF